MASQDRARIPRKRGNRTAIFATLLDPSSLLKGFLVASTIPSLYYFVASSRGGYKISLPKLSTGSLLRKVGLGNPQAIPEKPKNPYEIKLGANHTVTIEDCVEVFDDFLSRIREKWVGRKEGTCTYHDIWKDFHDLAVETLLPFDEYYLEHMPKRRDDDSIFVSMASYRDENCMETLEGAYNSSANPERLNIGLVQQNCDHDCISGVLANGKTEPIEPDPDCYDLFCATTLGQIHCDEGRVRMLKIRETESVGPFMARYYASKLWGGESWMLQIDSHMAFAQDWDSQSITMLKNAPSEKPIISHYPPSYGFDFKANEKKPGERLCGPAFATSSVENQIVRLEGSGTDREFKPIPRFAPFVAAGYFVAHSGILREAPYDPLVPWVFMGEEIIMSSRWWTHGYDIFSPTHSVTSHRYVRRHKPKYWETVGRLFWNGIDAPLGNLLTDRIKYQLGYPESAQDMIQTKSVLTAVNRYSMGKVRSVKEYLKMIGLDLVTKEGYVTGWCENGQTPEYAKHLTHLYK
jgi:[Skp1-protein]-hydroxyproline N-acetylglucosaminyltransferase